MENAEKKNTNRDGFVEITNVLFETGSITRLKSNNQLPILEGFVIKNYLRNFDGIKETYFEEKQILLEKHKIKGTYVFAKDLGNSAFWKDFNVLLNIKSKVNVNKLKIKKSILPDKIFSIEDLENLETIFEFIENGEEKPKKNKGKK